MTTVIIRIDDKHLLGPWHLDTRTRRSEREAMTRWACARESCCRWAQVILRGRNVRSEKQDTWEEGKRRGKDRNAVKQPSSHVGISVGKDPVVKSNITGELKHVCSVQQPRRVKCSLRSLTFPRHKLPSRQVRKFRFFGAATRKSGGVTLRSQWFLRMRRLIIWGSNQQKMIIEENDATNGGRIEEHNHSHNYWNKLMSWKKCLSFEIIDFFTHFSSKSSQFCSSTLSNVKNVSISSSSIVVKWIYLH